jgi:hypothetical protein
MDTRHAKFKMPNAKCKHGEASKEREMNAWLRLRGVCAAATFTPMFRIALCLQFAFCILHSGSAAAQQLLDRIVARVSGSELTLTDLQTARGFGVVAGPTEAVALEQLIDRQLLLVEVQRFPPPDPAETAVAAEVTREKAVAGNRLQELMASTGTDEARLHDIARDTLRLEAYIDQRFGTSMQVTDDEAAAYYGAHPDEFRRDGAAIPFEEALPVARERASIERRKEQVQRWLYDLRGRADIAIPREPVAR